MAAGEHDLENIQKYIVQCFQNIVLDTCRNYVIFFLYYICWTFFYLLMLLELGLFINSTPFLFSD